MNEQEWLAGYQSPPPASMLPERGDVTSAQAGPHVLDLGPSGAEADAVAEAKRLAENERFKIWEAGFMAGLVSVNGEHQKNPYQWHGLGYAPKDADLAEVRVRVFLGGDEMDVGAIGSIVNDRHGMRIERIYVNPEPGTR